MPLSSAQRSVVSKGWLLCHFLSAALILAFLLQPRLSTLRFAQRFVCRMKKKYCLRCLASGPHPLRERTHVHKESRVLQV